MHLQNTQLVVVFVVALVVVVSPVGVFLAAAVILVIVATADTFLQNTFMNTKYTNTNVVIGKMSIVILL